MTPFDPILHEHEQRIARLEASRRTMEDQLVVMAAVDRRLDATVARFTKFLDEQVAYEIAEKKRDDDWKARHEQWQSRQEEWKAHHELAMKEFDDKLNGLIGWLDDFVKRNPKNGK
jgi:hypothetical protein